MKIPLLKPSTLAFLREARKTRNFTLFDAIHGYIYLRFPYLYISLAKGDHPLSRRLAPVLRWIGRIIELQAKQGGNGNNPGFADTYHGKVMPVQEAKQLVSIKQPIHLENLEQVIPFSRAKDLILENPDHIAVLDCPCRAGKPQHCLPLDVCIIVGEPFVRFVLEHHPKRARRITSEEAMRILEEEDERGHVHHAFFKDAMLGRFYAICNCCSCCCGAMKAQREGTPMLISSGFVSAVDEERCIACGTCAQVCPFDAIQVNGHAVILSERCMGCGVCVGHCLQEALSLQRDPSRGEPLEIRRLVEMASPSPED
ncbi:MAG: 4Fe-4S binding protein [Anaerolinea sp.]